MSRSDYPPDYEESRGPLYGGNYPQPPPPYGFPGYGGPHPGQPSAPYPTDPNTPLYSGQPGGYPGGPYPGQPYQGGPGAGYPAPPPMPPMIPPTIPSDVLSSGEYFPHVSSLSLMNFAFLCRRHLIFFFFASPLRRRRRIRGTRKRLGQRQRPARLHQKGDHKAPSPRPSFVSPL